MIKTKYMFSEAKDTMSEAKAKAKDLALKAKDMTSCPRGQGHGLEDSISGKFLHKLVWKRPAFYWMQENLAQASMSDVHHAS